MTAIRTFGLIFAAAVLVAPAARSASFGDLSGGDSGSQFMGPGPYAPGPYAAGPYGAPPAYGPGPYAPTPAYGACPAADSCSRRQADRRARCPRRWTRRAHRRCRRCRPRRGPTCLSRRTPICRTVSCSSRPSVRSIRRQTPSIPGVSARLSCLCRGALRCRGGPILRHGTGGGSDPAPCRATGRTAQCGPSPGMRSGQ